MPVDEHAPAVTGERPGMLVRHEDRRVDQWGDHSTPGVRAELVTVQDVDAAATCVANQWKPCKRLEPAPPVELDHGHACSA